MSPPAGHRLRPHTADIVLEAWGPDREACLEQAVLGMAAAFVDIRGAATTEPLEVEVPAQPDGDLLVALLEEVLYAVDVRGLVPVRADLEPVADGGTRGVLGCAPVRGLSRVGSVPKAVSRHDLRIARCRSGWRCHVIVDV